MFAIDLLLLILRFLNEQFFHGVANNLANNLTLEFND